MKSKVACGSVLLSLVVLLSCVLLAIVILLLRLRNHRYELSAYECSTLLDLGVESARACIKSAISEATQEDNYWVIEQSDGSCAIITPYQVGQEWRYRYTGLSSHQEAIDVQRDELSFFRPLPTYSNTDAEAVSLMVNEREVMVQGLSMPVSDRHDVRLSWWIEDEGAKLSPRVQDVGLDKSQLSSFDKIPGITDDKEWWEKVADRFGLNESQISQWSLLIQQWQAGQIAEDELKYQVVEANFPTEFIAFMDNDMSFSRLPYVEHALIPVIDWTISRGIAGQAKVNLNAYVKSDVSGGVQGNRAEVISDLADYVLDALPEWEERGGGFPESYTKTLIANVLDYADADDNVSAQLGEYRGVEATPWINEWVTRYETQRIWNTAKGDYDYSLVITQYVELWNMSSQPIKGELEVSYEPGFEMLSSTGTRLPLENQLLLRDEARTSHNLEYDQIKAKWLFAEQSIELVANEHQLINLGSIIYDLETIGADFYQAEDRVVLNELVEPYQLASYRAWWNDSLVDRAGWANVATQSFGLAKNSELRVYTQGSTKSKIKTRLYQSSFTYTSGIQYRQSGGDPRMSYYARAQQAASAYPDNYSPHRRNVKLGLYNLDSIYKLKPSTRVLINDWGDGGHSSGYYPNHSFNQQSTSTATETVDPEDSVFLENKQEPETEAAVSYFSNRGYLVSGTELGAIFDPMMWSSTTAGWSGYLETPIKNIDQEAHTSAVVGGGNTLRIGRAEHPRFNQLGVKASHWLDLFHVGRGWHPNNQSDELRGSTQKVSGGINLNTASQEVLEILLYGVLEADANLSQQMSGAHEAVEALHPPAELLEQNQAQLQIEEIARAIVDYRKQNLIRSLAHVLEIVDNKGLSLFSNLSNHHVLGENIQANDAAQEELFARLYNQSTVRSKNFKLWMKVELFNKQGNRIGVRNKRAQIYLQPADYEGEEGTVIFIAETAFTTETAFSL